MELVHKTAQASLATSHKWGLCKLPPGVAISQGSLALKAFWLPWGTGRPPRTELYRKRAQPGGWST